MQLLSLWNIIISQVFIEPLTIFGIIIYRLIAKSLKIMELYLVFHLMNLKIIINVVISVCNK